MKTRYQSFIQRLRGRVEPTTGYTLHRSLPATLMLPDSLDSPFNQNIDSTQRGTRARPEPPPGPSTWDLSEFLFLVNFFFSKLLPTNSKSENRSVKRFNCRNGGSPRLCWPRRVVQLSARSAVFGFLLVDVVPSEGKLSTEHGCADIVIKSMTARVSSPHSPLICQPCSDGRLRKYMQNRWIRPLHTLPPISVSFTHCRTPSTPSHLIPPAFSGPHTHTHAATAAASRLRFPTFPFQRWSKTNYADWGARTF